MNSIVTSLLALATFLPAQLMASDYYPFEKKKEIYAAADLPRQSCDLIFSTEDPEWQDLDADLVVEKLNQIADGKTATILAASSVEFSYYCQPIKNQKTLQGRRLVLAELAKQDSCFDHLNNIMLRLRDVEYVFSHLLEQRQPKSAIEIQLKSFIFQGAFISVATACSVPYAWKHFLYDWYSYRAKQCNPVWLCAMVAVKIAGTVSMLYTNCLLVKNSAWQFYDQIQKADSFVLDFAAAMEGVEEINNILKENPTLANIYANIDNFPHIRKLNKRLNEALIGAKSRLNAQGSIFAFWKTKNSPFLYEEIKKVREPLILLYYAIARLDCMLAAERIRRDWEEKKVPVCLAEFADSPTPSFCFEDLRNICFNNCIANDFKLDGDVIISGPSTCGKSGAIRTITWGHVLGLAMLPIPGKLARFAPIDTIATYFNVGDNIAKGESSFKAQQRAITKITNLSTSLKAGKVLLAIDEPYKGITSEMAEKLVSKLVQDLASRPQVMFLMSTHCKDVTRIENEEESVVKNWQVIVEKHGDQFIRTFEIREGAAHWWFDDINEVSAFIEQIIRE